MVNDMDSHEISSVQFIHLRNHQCQLLVTSSWDSSLQIFDEGEQPEESRILRMAVGGHGKEDISCLAVSADLALIATGSVSGIIAVTFSILNSQIGVGLRIDQGGALLHGPHQVHLLALLPLPTGDARFHVQRGLRVLLGPEASSLRTQVQTAKKVQIFLFRFFLGSETTCRTLTNHTLRSISHALASNS